MPAHYLSLLRSTAAVLLLGSATLVNADAISANASTFKCLQDMKPVRGFFVDNIAGNVEGTLKAANQPNGGVYPPGSVVQLIPNEVMLKHEAGFSPATRDWEFFELDVSKKGSVIRKQGLVDVQNRFNGNCFGCHVQARPEWDLICEQGHGCAALPISRMTIKSLQQTDPRCKANDASVAKRITAWTVKLFTGL